MELAPAVLGAGSLSATAVAIAIAVTVTQRSAIAGNPFYSLILY